MNITHDEQSEDVPTRNGCLPPVCTITSTDPLEKRMAEALAAVLLTDGGGA